MSMKARIAGTVRGVSSGRVMVGGTARRITRAIGYIDGSVRALVTFTRPLTLAVTPGVTGFSIHASGPQYITTNKASATPDGGLAPYTYLWSGGDTPTLSSTSFSKTVAEGESVEETYSVTVTDSAGSTASGSVSAQFTNFGLNP